MHRPNNARSITKKKFADLQNSLTAWDFKEPLVVSKRGGKYHLVSGHQRARAATDLGYDEVPCVVLEDLTAEQEAALGIRLNRQSGEDVKDEMAEVLAGLEVDLQEMAGFDLEALDDLQPDPFDEEPKPPKTDRYTTEQLRTMAKSYHPVEADTILEFIAWIEKSGK